MQFEMVKQKKKGARSSFEGKETGACSVCLRSVPELERIKQQYSPTSCWVLYFLNLNHRPTQTLVLDSVANIIHGGHSGF